MLVYTHPECLLKDNGFNHPERKERLESIGTLLIRKTSSLDWFKAGRIKTFAKKVPSN